jgi:CRISPR-associated endonuclease Csn1
MKNCAHYYKENMENKITSGGRNLEIGLDVGHSSIGWAVLESTGNKPAKGSDNGVNGVQIHGCGSVIFRADDCLASQRRGFRRQRRHIRSTRQRIHRIKTLLAHLKVLKLEELDRPGSPWPWLLAARVLQGEKLLTWHELWDVLRWYAHNRGYDGNRRWSDLEAAAQDEDTEKEENAHHLMETHGTKTMAETFCKVLGVDPKNPKKCSSMVRFKGLNAAFPRDIVEGETRCILKAHLGKLKGLDAQLIRTLLGNDNDDHEAWQAIPCPGIKLPNRYSGGLLFGQLVPRFDNRIISTCPITGEKVPSRNSSEFLNFRWAMQLANIQVSNANSGALRPLTAEERKKIDQQMRAAGHLTPKELIEAVRTTTGCVRDNLETMLMLPDAKDALLLDPVQKLITSDKVAPLWNTLPERLQKRYRGQWRRRKATTRAAIREQLLSLKAPVEAFDQAINTLLDQHNTKTKKNAVQLSRDAFMSESIKAEFKGLDGRAAYARSVMVEACKQIMDGQHPKEPGGCLFVTEQMRQAQLNRTTAQQTNNHLVRHRLLILERLLKDIIKDYAGGDKNRIQRITIEVNRDLGEMSGMTNKEKAQDLGLRIANHHHVSETLEKAFDGKHIPITAGLIRKARIADDLNWTCPYTGQLFEPVDLVTRRVDKDHIVPRSDRTSDSLDSLVITYAAINKWKGRRTALKFIEEEQGKTVPDMPQLSIVSLSRYKQFVSKLAESGSHDDDKRRKKRRKQLLMTRDYTEKAFTPRDLTQTSQLVRLGAQVITRIFQDCTQRPVVVSLPGSVTGTVRKSWRVLGCLSLANPQVLDENGELKTKTDIRDITHLHHALDACVLALASHYIPNNGRVWELILKRHLTEPEQRELSALGIFGFDEEHRFQLNDLHESIKEQIRQKLAEKRVVQHIPARMDGLRLEQNMWRVKEIKDGEATLEQRIRQPDGSRSTKTSTEKVGKLLGIAPIGGGGKLKKNKGALVIPDNFGLALDPTPTIIPYHKVWDRLQELKLNNHGKPVRVIKNGSIIKVAGGKTYKGIWKVFSAKNNATGMALDIGSPDVVRLKNKTEGHKINVLLNSLIKDGLEVAKPSLTGVASCPTTSSV